MEGKLKELTLVDEENWFAVCSCGWTSEVPNDSSDTLLGKVRTHLAAFHKGLGADMAIAGVVARREKGKVPYGQPADPRAALAGALARIEQS